MERATPREVLIALNATPALGRPAAYRLAQELERFLQMTEPGGGADPATLGRALGVPRAQAAKAIAALPRAADVAAREVERAARLGARVEVLGDPGYPEELAQLSPPPPVLYLRGELPPRPTEEAVAIVGSRRADAYGREVADLFARALAGAGVAVVSGFARGIDAAAHRGALAVPGGRTVAVLGCGFGVDYPSGHRELEEEIAGRGAVATELPCDLPPRAWHFPIRNRVIAALSAGTLVVQATPRSGSLITARHALDLGREVWAVPGRIFDEAALGPNSLIREGAALVQHPRDIIDDLRGDLLVEHLPRLRPAPLPARRGEAIERAPSTPERLPGEPPPGQAREVYAALAAGALAIPEEIAVRAGLSVDRVLGALLELELGGWVDRHPGPAFARRN